MDRKNKLVKIYTLLEGVMNILCYSDLYCRFYVLYKRTNEHDHTLHILNSKS